MCRLILILLLLPNTFAETMPAKLLLENGETLNVDGYVNAWAGASNEYVFILRYEVSSIEDKGFLQEQAELIWKSFRPLIESKDYEYAGIKAIKYDAPKNLLGNRKFTAYTHVLFKKENGSWEFYPSKN